jgi:COMPASS component SWD2
MAQPHASSSKQPSQKVQVSLTNELIVGHHPLRRGLARHELTTQGRLKPAKVFHDAVERPPQPESPGLSHETQPRPHLPQITSLSFDDTGERCLTTGEDEGFAIWDMRKGRCVRDPSRYLLTRRKLKNFWSKKYGVGLGRFTHRSGNIVHASTKVVADARASEDTHALRYHSTHDNKYLSYFKGHTAR